MFLTSGATAHKVVSFRGFRGTTTVPVLSGSEKQPSFESVPTVDCAKMFSNSIEDRLGVAAQVRDAFAEASVLYAVNHGMPQRLIDNVYQVSRDFFHLPKEEKMKVHNSKSMYKRGYQYLLEGRYDDPDRGDFRECFKMVTDPQDPESGCDRASYSPGLPNLWPENPPEFRQHLYYYNHALRMFAEKFIRIMALALGAEETALDGVINPFSGLSTIRYPPYLEAVNEGRAVHTDYSIFTILTQLSSTTALEVLDRNGHFISVPPVKGSVVINIGDFAQRISNDIFSSTIHRVVNHSFEERLSVAYFFDADPEAWIEPLKSCGVPKYLGIRAGDWQAELLLRPRYKKIDEVR